MEGIRIVMRKKYTCIIAQIFFYETETNNTIKVYRVFSCVLDSVVDNYVCIEYLCCRYKTLSVLFSHQISQEESYNGLLGIGIR